MRPKVAFVLVTKNEAPVIESVLASLRGSVSGLEIEAIAYILADDSTDGTPELARAWGARIVAGGNVGLGRAYYQGVKAAAELDVDYICTLDGDGQTEFSEISQFISTLRSSGADLVVGSRFAKQGLVHYKYPALNRFGIYLLSTYLTLVTGQRFTDSHGGLRLMRKAVARDLEIWGTHTYVQEAIVDAVSRGYRVVEIPSQWKERKHSHSRVLHSIARYARKTAPILLRRALWSLQFRLARRVRTLA